MEGTRKCTSWTARNRQLDRIRHPSSPGIDDNNGYVDDFYGYDFHNRDSDPYIEGDNNHGTHVSGTVSGDETWGGNITGVPPEAHLMACQVLDQWGGRRAVGRHGGGSSTWWTTGLR